MMFTTKKYLLLAGAVPVGNAESLADLFKSLEDYAKDASTLRNDKTLKKAFTNLQETVDAAVDVAQTTSDVADSAAVFAVELANGAREFANTADDVANEAARASVTLDAIANGMKQAQDTANAIFDFFSGFFNENNGSVNEFVQESMKEITALTNMVDEVQDAVTLVLAGAEALANADVRQVVFKCLLEDPGAFNPLAWYKSLGALGVSNSSQIICLAEAASKAGKSSYGSNFSCAKLLELVENSASNDIAATINCNEEYVNEDIMKIAIDAISESANVFNFVEECAPATLGVTGFGQLLGDIEITSTDQIKCLADSYYDYKALPTLTTSNSKATCQQALVALFEGVEDGSIDLVSVLDCSPDQTPPKKLGGMNYDETESVEPQ